MEPLVTMTIPGISPVHLRQAANDVERYHPMMVTTRSSLRLPDLLRQAASTIEVLTAELGKAEFERSMTGSGAGQIQAGHVVAAHAATDVPSEQEQGA